MRSTVLILALAVLGAIVPGAFAQEERYRIERQEGGYARIDTRTGAMSFCKETGGQLVCKVAADERDAYEVELARLQQRLEALEGRVAKLESAGPSIVSEENFDQSLDMMERFFRRFMGVIGELQKDGAERPGQPQRT